MVKQYNFKIYIILLIILKLNCENNINSIISFNDTGVINEEKEKYPIIRKLSIFNNFNNEKNKKNLIIGAVTNYSWDKVRNFFISLFKVGFKNCDLVFFVGNLTESTIDKIKQCGVIIYNIPKKFMEMKALIHNIRFKIFEEYLIDNKDKYNMVFTTDVADSIFQSDLFQYFNYNRSFFVAFYEDGIIKHCQFNTRWSKYYCGEEGLNAIGHNRIICSGSILATVDKLIEFSQGLWKTIHEKNTLNILGEQGYLNCLIHYYKSFNDCLVKSDNHGPVMTVALSPRSRLVFDKDNNLLNYDGKIASFVHQYNRKNDIFEIFSKKFNDTNIINNIPIEGKTKPIKNKIFLFVGLFFVVFILFFFLYLLRRKKGLKKKEMKFKKVKIKYMKKINY